MTSYECLTHIMPQNGCMKFIYPFSGALYIIWEFKKRVAPFLALLHLAGPDSIRQGWNGTLVTNILVYYCHLVLLS
jgi:hypothetical protein